MLGEEGYFCSGFDHFAEKLPEMENCILSFLFFIKVNIIISNYNVCSVYFNFMKGYVFKNLQNKADGSTR